MDQIPIITRQAKTALWLALVLSIIDLGLACGNVGTSSLFIGLVAASMTIIHLSTHLGVIGTREKQARRAAADTSHSQVGATDAARFPPPSTLGSILVTAFLVVMYLAAFAISVWGLVTNELYNLSPIVVCLDAAFEMLCALALIWLLYIGVKERREYMELSRKIKLRDLPDSA